MSASHIKLFFAPIR